MRSNGAVIRRLTKSLTDRFAFHFICNNNNNNNNNNDNKNNNNDDIFIRAYAAWNKMK